MKNFKLYIPLLFAALILGLGACDEDPTDDLREIIREDLGYVPKISQFRLLTPTSPVPAQSNLSFDLRYWSEGTIDDIKFFSIVGTDTSLIGELDYTPAYSKVTRTDSLIFNYQLPASLVSGTNFSIQARVANVGLEEYPTLSTLALRVQ